MCCQDGLEWVRHNNWWEINVKTSILIQVRDSGNMGNMGAEDTECDYG